MQEPANEEVTSAVSITDIISQAAKDPPKLWNNEEYIEEKKKAIHNACTYKSIETVWDEFLSYTVAGTTDSSTDVVQSSTEVAQLDHGAAIARQEAGDTKGVQARSFGITYPSYQYAMRPYVEEFAKKTNPKGLLIGSMSEHSANEFEALIKHYNKNAQTVAIDIGRTGLKQASGTILKAQADASCIPLTSQHMDVIASNYLIKYLHSPAKSRGKTIVDTINESYRLLKKDGILLMVDETLPVTQTYQTAWLSRLILEETLGKIGFTNIKTDYATSFPTHKAKRDWDYTKLQRSDSMHSMGMYGPYSYVVSARK